MKTILENNHNIIFASSSAPVPERGIVWIFWWQPVSKTWQTPRSFNMFRFAGWCMMIPAELRIIWFVKQMPTPGRCEAVWSLDFCVSKRKKKKHVRFGFHPCGFSASQSPIQFAIRRFIVKKAIWKKLDQGKFDPKAFGAPHVRKAEAQRKT